MSAIDKDIVLLIENNNDHSLYLNGVEILLKLLENVLKEPQNLKFRKIRLENKTIKEKLVSLKGMKNLLLSIGFQQYNNGVELEYVLPPNTLLAKVKNYRDFMIERQKFLTSSKNQNTFNSDKNKSIDAVASTSTKHKASTSSKKLSWNTIKIEPSKTYIKRISFPTVLAVNNKFLKFIEVHSDQVMQYEDKNLLNFGNELIPIKRITDNALKSLRYIQKEITRKNMNENNVSEEPCIKDLILIELSNWFNTEFFEWINEVRCKICNTTENCKKYNSIENNMRVEIGFCCGVQTKFYRYNDIVDLLKTRRGRCGEYANCFTFFCRCLGYDARLVHATFDHVWTEVYSVKQKRWIHIDPSDNVIDAPLMYQQGWKRKIDYVFAYSRDDLQDVTWRYTNDHKNTLLQRNNASELEILHVFDLVRNKRQQNITESRKKYLIKRTLRELVELMKPREATENERQGRSSGSMAWRLDRGEQTVNLYVFELNDVEIEAKQFNLRYSCSKNEYQRYLKDNSNVVNIKEKYPGWESIHYTSKSIFRKVEKDWQMVYLCRQENSEHAELVWKFDFNKSNLRIKNFSFKIHRETFKTGQAEIALADLNDIKVTDVISLVGFNLKIKLYGGDGDVAWQHAQLFRQNINDTEFPFDINIEFY